MSNHLASCQFVPASVKSKALSSKGLQVEEDNDDNSDIEDAIKKHERSNSAASASSRQLQERAAKKQRTFQVVAVKSMPYTDSNQQDFENQLLKAFVSSGTAFNMIEDPEVQQLFTKFVPSAVLPTRQRLEKHILHRVIVQMEGEVKKSVNGHFATLSCDRWKDVSQRHLVAFMLTVNREVKGHLI